MGKALRRAFQKVLFGLFRVLLVHHPSQFVAGSNNELRATIYNNEEDLANGSFTCILRRNPMYTCYRCRRSSGTIETPTFRRYRVHHASTSSQPATEQAQ